MEQKNENTMCHNLWCTAKAELKRKEIVLDAYLTKEEKLESIIKAPISRPQKKKGKKKSEERKQ